MGNKENIFLNPSLEDVIIGYKDGYPEYRRPDGSTYVSMPSSVDEEATVTAFVARDHLGKPIRDINGNLITGSTKEEMEAKRRRYVLDNPFHFNNLITRTWDPSLASADMGTFNAITGGVFNLTPIQVGRGIHNLSQGKDPGFILGNSGVVSEEYAQEHPWLALGANVLGEGLTNPLAWFTGGKKIVDVAKPVIKNSKPILIKTKKIKPLTRTQPKQVVNITKENASQITDLQWDEAFNDALEKGNVEKLKELRDLHFRVKSGNDTQVFAHSTSNSFNEFDQQFFGKTDEGFNGKGFYFSTTRIPENPAIYKIAKGPHGEIPYMNYGPKKKYFYLKGNREFNVGNPNRNFFEESNTVGFVGPENATVSEVIVGKPSQIKSARTLTYDDEGILIPLSKRDNFSINDFRYKYGGFIKYN